MKRPIPRAIPVWWWVTPLVLGFHLLLFWMLSGRPALPLAAPRLPRQTAAAPPADFAARETTEREPRTGEIINSREFTVPTRLATPPPSPTARP